MGLNVVGRGGILSRRWTSSMLHLSVVHEPNVFAHQHPDHPPIFVFALCNVWDQRASDTNTVVNSFIGKPNSATESDASPEPLKGDLPPF